MRFSVTAALLAYVGSALAQNPDFNPVYRPESGEELVAGTTVTIEWTTPEEYADVTISIALIGGKTQNTQVHIVDVASGVPNSDERYEWSIPSDIGGENFYGLVLTSEENPDDWQYSNPFNILVADDDAQDNADDETEEGEEEEEDGDDDDADVSAAAETSETVTVTTSAGAATVTLSLAESTVTSESSSLVVEETSSAVPVETSSSLVVTSSLPASTLVSSVTSAPASSAPASEAGEPSSSASATPDEDDDEDDDDQSAAPKVAASVYALIGGLAIAALM